MSNFKRENRYTVLKHTDIHEALDAYECEVLIELEEKVALHRENVGKRPLVCVSVESDWPEYNIVWDLLKIRFEK